jgi:CHRD domain
MRRTSTAFGMAALAMLAVTPAMAAAPDSEILLESRLSGDQVVQQTGGDPDGTGTATILVDAKDGVACFDVQTANVDTPISGRIQSGSAGAIGPPVVFLFENQDASVNGCAPVDRKALREIGKNPERFYLNVVNDAFPVGAIRGQLAPAG